MTFKEKYGSWALVTGSSSGIGEKLAVELAQKGLNLILVSRKTQNLRALKIDLESKFNIEIVLLEMDLTLGISYREIVQVCANKDLGLVANVAGELYLGDFDQQPIEKELEGIALNVNSSVWLARYFGDLFKKKRRGGIIFIGSMLGYGGVPYANAYAASKAFINNYGEGLGYELKKFGVDVLTVAPGLTKTNMTATHDFSPLPMKMLSPEKVAENIVFSLGKKTTTTYGSVNNIMNWFSRHLMSRRQNVKMYGYLLNKVNQLNK